MKEHSGTGRHALQNRLAQTDAGSHSKLRMQWNCGPMGREGWTIPIMKSLQKKLIVELDILDRSRCLMARGGGTEI